MQMGSLFANRDRGVIAEEAKAVVTTLVGSNPRGGNRQPGSADGEASAQTFAVEFRGVGAYAPPHFHAVDQYQVFYGGSGRIGPHDIEPGTVTIHYADRYVSYGPILPDAAAGLAYVTVRMRFDKGLFVMPEDRRQRLERGGRHVVERVVLDRMREEGTRDLVARHEDGLFAAVLVIDPNEAIDEIPRATVGQQLILIDGSIRVGDESHRCPTAVVLAAGERPVGFSAGKDGAVLLSLHFPSPDRALLDDAARGDIAARAR